MHRSDPDENVTGEKTLALTWLVPKPHSAEQAAKTPLLGSSRQRHASRLGEPEGPGAATGQLSTTGVQRNLPVVQPELGSSPQPIALSHWPAAPPNGCILFANLLRPKTTAYTPAFSRLPVTPRQWQEASWNSLWIPPPQSQPRCLRGSSNTEGCLRGIFQECGFPEELCCAVRWLLHPRDTVSKGNGRTQTRPA